MQADQRPGNEGHRDRPRWAGHSRSHHRRSGHL